jgi:hypothetical protein
MLANKKLITDALANKRRPTTFLANKPIPLNSKQFRQQNDEPKKSPIEKK